MTVQIELPQIIALIVSLLGLLMGFGKFLLSQIDNRLHKIESQHAQEIQEWRKLEREVMQLRADLPDKYVRREDYIRGQSVLESKMDALYQRIDALIQRDRTP